MSKIKKMLSLVVAMVMVLAMSVPAFAATKSDATITVKNADKATLEFAQVIKADQTTRTGWNFVNDEVANAYIEAFGVTDAQEAIDAVIANKDADKLGLAQANAAGKVSFVPMSNPERVNAAGIYLVKATEPGYTYNIMGAYIGFGEVTIDGTEYDYPSLLDTELTAKKTPIQVNKEVAEAEGEADDNVTKTGDILTYTVTTNVPFIAPTDTDKTFFVYDELTGAEYTDKDNATITLAGANVTGTYKIDWNDTEGKFSVDLSGMINDANSNAGSAVVITYKVKVTSENDTITNTAKAGHKNGEDFGSKEVKTYEGNITLTKTNEDETVKLANAGFEVRKNDGEDALTFVKLADGVYKYDPAGTVTEVKTKADGTVKIQGLDAGKYTFKEITAPEGYSVNTTDVSATLTVTEEDGKATDVLTQTTSMKDTKLSALPSTGGIGTTIFTIGGCVVMIAAAGLFFATRKKSAK